MPALRPARFTTGLAGTGHPRAAGLPDAFALTAALALAWAVAAVTPIGRPPAGPAASPPRRRALTAASQPGPRGDQSPGALA